MKLFSKKQDPIDWEKIGREEQERSQKRNTEIAVSTRRDMKEAFEKLSPEERRIIRREVAIRYRGNRYGDLRQIDLDLQCIEIARYITND